MDFNDSFFHLVPSGEFFSGFSNNHPIIRGIKPPGISSMFSVDLTLFIKAWQPGN